LFLSTASSSLGQLLKKAHYSPLPEFLATSVYKKSFVVGLGGPAGPKPYALLKTVGIRLVERSDSSLACWEALLHPNLGAE